MLHFLRRPAALVEILETRIALAAHVWQGPTSGGVWSTAANWSGGVPTSGEVGGTIVEFDGNISSTDNIAGLVVDEVHFAAGGNTIAGSAGVSLGINGANLVTNILSDAGTNLIASTLNLVISGASTLVTVKTGTLTIGSDISGTVGLVLASSAGTLALTGLANSYTGITTVSSGTLALNSNGVNTAISGNLVIGGVSATPGAAKVQLLQSSEIPDSAQVTVHADGVFDLNGFSETIGSLSLESAAATGASVTTGVGQLILGGGVSLSVSGAGGTAATMSGNVFLSSGTHNFQIARGAATSDLKITAMIGGSGSLEKSGHGILELANAVNNTYTGTTLIDDGVVLLTSPAFVSTSNTIVVGDGVGGAGTAELRFGQSSVLGDTTAITVAADGLLNLAGFQDIVGAVTVNSGGAIDLGSGFLTATAGLTLAADSFFGASGHGHLAVTGAVAVGGQLAELMPAAQPVGTMITLIANDGVDPVTGTFTGLPEGAVFGTAAGLFQISYHGGDGNDVVATAVDASTIIKLANGGKSAAYTDVDGDLVTVTTTKGAFAANDFTFGGFGAGLTNGYQLQSLDISAAAFAGAAIKFVAKPTALGGDGHVNVGFINASGRDLAALTVPGDVSRISAGDANPKLPGVTKLTVDSLGEFGSVTQGLQTGLSCDVTGVGTMLVKGNVLGENLDLGKIGHLTIGGSLIGSAATAGGNLTATAALGISIGGSLIAPAGTITGEIKVSGDLGSLTIGNDVIGSAIIASGGKFGAVAIKGGVEGGSVASPAVISGAGALVAPLKGADVAIGSITLGKSAEFLNILAGYDMNGTGVNADASVGKINIGGDFRAGSILVGAAAGADGIFGTADDTKLAVARDSATRVSTIASLIVKGQASGTTAAGDLFTIEAEHIVAAKIDGHALKLAPGSRSTADVFPIGFASGGPDGLPSDFYLREISA